MKDTNKLEEIIKKLPFNHGDTDFDEAIKLIKEAHSLGIQLGKEELRNDLLKVFEKSTHKIEVQEIRDIINQLLSDNEYKR